MMTFPSPLTAWAELEAWALPGVENHDTPLLVDAREPFTRTCPSSEASMVVLADPGDNSVVQEEPLFVVTFR
jgi:hypothetical protein